MLESSSNVHDRRRSGSPWRRDSAGSARGQGVRTGSESPAERQRSGRQSPGSWQSSSNRTRRFHGEELDVQMSSSGVTYHCPLCFEEGLSESQLVEHVYFQHPAQQEITVCPICAHHEVGDGSFITRDLRAHLRSKHRQPRGGTAGGGIVGSGSPGSASAHMRRRHSHQEGAGGSSSRNSRRGSRNSGSFRHPALLTDLEASANCFVSAGDAPTPTGSLRAAHSQGYCDRSSPTSSGSNRSSPLEYSAGPSRGSTPSGGLPSPSQRMPPSSSSTLRCSMCSTVMHCGTGPSSPFGFDADATPVVAVLFCGHIFHPDCLSQVTSASELTDPSCPICSRSSCSTPHMRSRSCSPGVM